MHVCILSSVHLALDNRVFYREARSLRQMGHRVTLIAVHDRDEIRDGIHIRPLPHVPRKQRPALWRSLWRMARQEAADLYLFHDPELLLIAPWLRWRTGRPVIYDVHEVYGDFIQVKDYLPRWLRYPLGWAFGRLEPWLARPLSGLIFADDEIARTFARLRCPKVTLFNYPGRELLAAGQAATVTWGPRPPVVLYLGGMERNRGTALMLEAFARVRAQFPAAQLWLVGHFAPPDLEQEVRAQALALGLTEAVTITGRVPFERIGDYLRQASVGWVSWQDVPKNARNIPTKLFEYMAYAVPIVSSDLPSTRTYVQPGENGFLARADDPQAHADAILTLLRDPALGERLGRRGQMLTATQFNWDAMHARLLEFVSLWQANGR